jgi:hypothetical protein
MHWLMGRVNVGGQLRLLVLGVLALFASSTTEEPSVRVLFLTDCSPYSDWQTMAMVYSYMYSGHKGPITRVMCCSEEDRLTYNKEMLGLVETHIAASFAVNPGDKDDYYVAYNKPGAVIDYLEHVTPEEEWLLVLDSDMIIRMPWKVRDFELSLGWAVGSDYGYLVGVNNDLADRHIPEIPRRNDSFAGPVGRRSDMVGGFFFIHRTDLKRLSKLWLKYTFDVRQDPEVRLGGRAPGSSVVLPPNPARAAQLFTIPRCRGVPLHTTRASGRTTSHRLLHMNMEGVEAPTWRPVTATTEHKVVQWGLAWDTRWGPVRCTQRATPAQVSAHEG